MPRDLPLGNGSLLVTFDQTYQLRDLYWPHVGLENHTKGLVNRFGIWVDGQFRWIDDAGWSRRLQYSGETMVSDVELVHADLPVTIVCHDVVDFHENLYVRRVNVTSTAKQEIDVKIMEIDRPEVDAQLVAEQVAEQLERRASFRRTLKKTVEQTMGMGALGCRIRVSGRLGGAEIARSEVTGQGKIPLHTLRADIDYGFAEAHTTYGNLGVKCWIYRGDLAPDRESIHAVDAQAGQVPQDPAR